MEIKKDIRNELFKRQEVRLEIQSENSPSFDEVRKEIVEKFGKPEENMDVYNIKGRFGKKVFMVDAYIYDSKEDLEKIKALQKTSKQRKEERGKGKGGEESKEEETSNEKSGEEKPEEGIPVEERPEQEKQEPEKKPTEGPVEERPEQEEKAVKEEKQAEVESKEP